MTSTISLKRPPTTQRPSGYFDTHLHCTIEMSTPRADPVAWYRFMTGARASYRKYGVEAALEFDSVIGGHSTALFFLAYDADHRALGGFRIQGPYRTARDTHADLEWAGHPGRAELTDMITERIPHGVVELKSVWMAPGARPGSEPGYLGAIGATLGAAALGSRFTLATSAEHSAGPYVRSGGVVATHIPPVPYPDDRYVTRPLWWDQRTLGRDAAPDQYRRIIEARNALFPNTNQKALAS